MEGSLGIVTVTGSGELAVIEMVVREVVSCGCGEWVAVSGEM